MKTNIYDGTIHVLKMVSNNSTAEIEQLQADILRYDLYIRMASLKSIVAKFQMDVRENLSKIAADAHLDKEQKQLLTHKTLELLSGTFTI